MSGPGGFLDMQLPLDRERHEPLVEAVLAVTDPARLAPADCAQIALQLTEHSWAVVRDIEQRAGQLPKHDGRKLFSEDTLRRARRQLDTPLEPTLACVQNRARTVRDLYARLDRLSAPRPAPD